MANGVISRSFCKANAYAWAVTGKDDSGRPTMDKVGNVEFVSSKPSQADAYRALRNAGVKCQRQFVGFDVLEETVYAMTVDRFLANATPVSRQANGRIDTSQLD